MKGRGTLKLTPISVFGKTTPSTMSMMNTPPKNSFTKILLRQLFFLSSRGTIQQYWLMDRLEQEKPTQWKVLNIVPEILREVLSPEVWKKYLDSSKCNLIRTRHSW